MTQLAATDQARLPGTTGPGAPQRRPFNGKRTLFNVVPVRFERSFISEPFDAGDLILTKGDQIVVDTKKGPMLAQAVGLVQRRVMEVGSVRRVIRTATTVDIESHESNRERAKESFRFCLKRIRARNLPMKLCQVEYILDGSRVLFYFSAEKRVDFRQLVRDLAGNLDARIEMRQVGVRDGAGLIGGIGPCGKELCCSSFLTSFRSISIRHAKDQGLTLNPKKVSGMCGRLMCCLVYEHATYKAARKGAPRVNRAVDTIDGAGVVTEVDLLQRRVRILLETGEFESYQFGDVVVDNQTVRRARDIRVTSSRPKSDAKVTRAGARLEEAYVWDGAEAEEHPELETVSGPDEQGERPKRKRRRRRRGQGRPPGEGDQTSASGQGGQTMSGGGQSQSGKQPGSGEGGPSRRRRRGRRKPDGDKPAGQAQGQSGSEKASGSAAQGNQAAAPGGEGQNKPRRRRRRRRRPGGPPKSGGGGGQGPKDGGGGSGPKGGGGGGDGSA